MSLERPRDGILAAVGHTPLVRLRNFLDSPSVQLYAKLESFNPGGSAKDRPALEMIEAAIQSGEIGSESTIIESSSGNMGIGLAQVCRYYGLRFICVVDPLAQRQNIAVMRALGAEVEVVREPRHGSYLRARLARVCWLLEHVQGSFWPNQYASQHNPKAHYQGTIREVDDALDGRIDYLFVATSSTGTAQGCRDYLRDRRRHTKVVAVDAVGSVLFGGSAGMRHIPGLGASQEPKLARGQRFHRLHRVSDIECVIECRRLAKQEAMLVGGSSGGVLSAVRSMQDQLEGTTCVAILHDSGTRYLDTVFDDAWVQRTLGYSRQAIEQQLNTLSNETVGAGTQ